MAPARGGLVWGCQVNQLVVGEVVSAESGRSRRVVTGPRRSACGGSGSSKRGWTARGGAGPVQDGPRRLQPPRPGRAGKAKVAATVIAVVDLAALRRGAATDGETTAPTTPAEHFGKLAQRLLQTSGGTRHLGGKCLTPTPVSDLTEQCRADGFRLTERFAALYPLHRLTGRISL
jgi:hypothetical protein